ncbi:MAG: hypothetical protein JXR88_00560 [Clostridia bacterium]|nr:hypothetical protein [Clostridia bacterium]
MKKNFVILFLVTTLFIPNFAFADGNEIQSTNQEDEENLQNISTTDEVDVNVNQLEYSIDELIRNDMSKTRISIEASNNNGETVTRTVQKSHNFYLKNAVVNMSIAVTYSYVQWFLPGEGWVYSDYEIISVGGPMITNLSGPYAVLKNESTSVTKTSSTIATQTYSFVIYHYKYIEVQGFYDWYPDGINSITGSYKHSIGN